MRRGGAGAAGVGGAIASLAEEPPYPAEDKRSASSATSDRAAIQSTVSLIVFTNAAMSPRPAPP